MNLLTIIVLLIIALFALRGYRQGVVKSIVSVISLLASIIVVSLVTPWVTEFIETTALYDVIEEQCQETFSLHGEIDEAGENNDEDASVAQIQDSLIDQLEIPDVLKNSLKNHNTADTYQKLNITNFSEYVPKFMADIIVRAMSFVIAWVVVAVFVHFVIMGMDAIANIPIMHGANQFFGLGLGIFRGLIAVWILFIVITILGGTNTGRTMLKMIAESPILRILYDTNMILHTIQSLAASLF